MGNEISNKVIESLKTIKEICKKNIEQDYSCSACPFGLVDLSIPENEWCQIISDIPANWNSINKHEQVHYENSKVPKYFNKY